APIPIASGAIVARTVAGHRGIGVFPATHLSRNAQHIAHEAVPPRPVGESDGAYIRAVGEVPALAAEPVAERGEIDGIPVSIVASEVPVLVALEQDVVLPRHV